MSNKPGRNDPCPCGSGKKFKRCHGSIEQLDNERMEIRARLTEFARTSKARHEAMEHQRREQQGLGKPILSAIVNNQRVVVVNKRLLSSNNWQTFQDFLHDYPRIALGDGWFLDEARKAPGEGHLIATWFVRASELAAASRAKGEPTTGVPATGALCAYLRFAYDLYALHHSVAVEQLLLDRIKSPRSFPGALYEVRVAAALLRAGFTLELEDESDRRSTHVEFVATHTLTSAKYSVEAKRREGMKLKLNKLLHGALIKRADHPRLVFIDTNDGRLEMHKFEQLPLPLAEARQQLKLYSMDPISRGLPPAYVVATWAPEEHHLESSGVPFGAMLLGFGIDDLAPGYRTLLEQVQIRRRHGPVFELLHSIESHRAIPATFDGEASAFARGAPPDRLKVGETYEVADADGSAITGILESGVVMTREKIAWCTFRISDGRRVHSTVPLTDIELQAYQEHPATFFGTVDRNAGRKQMKTPMDAFEFLWESYEGTKKELLIEWMKSAPDVEWLASLSQEEVATHYCVRMAQNMIQRRAAESKTVRGEPTP
jgi:hypothetical protein